jgi:hypothetical protein
MKNLALLLIITGCFLISSCKKDSQSESFKLITGPVWTSDSLLANGNDASGPGGMLENFKGEARFNSDGTGYFGIYTGTWRFAYNETQIVISADALAIPLNAKIAGLTKTSLKITTSYPNLLDPSYPTRLRLTFKAR